MTDAANSPAIAHRAARLVDRVRGGVRNAAYDRQTLAVMRRVLGQLSNCIDVGAHRGTVLRHMVRLAPAGRHHAFEPLPAFHARLVQAFPRVAVHRVALSDAPGAEEFAYVPGRPTRSGFRARAEDRAGAVETLTVTTAQLDDIIGKGEAVAFIKIDVEGAELRVLRGATATLGRSRPFVVFEHGVGAADLYGQTTDALYDVLSDCGLEVSRVADWLARRPPLAREAFAEEYLSGRNYYFLAHPPRR